MSDARKNIAQLIEFPPQPVLSAEQAQFHDPVPELSLCGPPLTLRGVFHPLGFSLEILTNDPLVLEAANDSWGHLRPRHISPTVQVRVCVSGSDSIECPPAPVTRGQRYLLSFAADANNHGFCDIKGGLACLWLTRPAVQHRLYFRYHLLESAAMALISGAYAPALHAACVSRHGRGMLLCGRSGAGKSSLAYACARAGWTYTTDDSSYLLLDAAPPRVVGNSHKLRFRPSATTLFPELQSHGLTPRAEGKPSIEILTSELPGLITADEAPIHYLIQLDRHSRGPAELVPITTEAALHRFEESLYPGPEIRREQIAALRSLAPLKAYELRYSFLAEAVGKLELLARDMGKTPA
jgi:hypothetical protein